jgi:hypothetical protein
MIPDNFDEGWSAGDLEPRGPAPPGARRVG